MPQTVIDLCGSDMENEGPDESTSFIKRRGPVHNDDDDDSCSHEKSASDYLDSDNNDQSINGKTESSLRESSLLGSKRLLELPRNSDSDEDSVDFMSLPIYKFKVAKKSGQGHDIMSAERMQQDAEYLKHSEGLVEPKMSSNSMIELLDDTMDHSEDDSNDKARSLIIQENCDAISNYCTTTQQDDCNTKYKSWDKNNESKEKDDYIILLSSDEEKEEEIDGYTRKSTNNTSKVQIYSNNDSSDSDDDVLPSPAPFQRKVTFDGKINQGQRLLDKLEGSLSEERTNKGKGNDKKSDDNDDDDDESISSSVVSWHFVTQQDHEDNAASTSSHWSKPPDQTARTNDIHYDCSDTDEDELLSQQIFKTVNSQSSSSRSLRGNNGRGQESGSQQSLKRVNSQNSSNHFSREKQGNGEESGIGHTFNSGVSSSITNPLPIDLNVNSSHVAPVGGLDLMSPVASIGRPSVGSASSASSLRKLKVPIPAIPVANEIGGKLYPDLRNLFIRELIKHARNLRRFTYQKGPLDGTIRAVNDLTLYAFPIRTAEAATCIKGIGGELIGVLKDAQNSVKKKQSPYEPPAGKFSSAAAAALVVLLNHERDKTGDDRYLSMEDLLNKVNEKTDCPSGGKIFNNGVEYYLNKTNLDPSWMQIRKLCSTGLIKERKRKTLCPSGFVYELEPDGRQEARALKERLARGPLPKGPLRQLAAHSVLEDYGNITVVMDFREGGGGGRKLHDMCAFMDEHEIPYVVRDLKISDYVFFVGDKLVPVLIERKSIEDVACSLHDGRWERQQRNMRKAQYVLGGGEERKCHLCYLIEGDIERTTVHGGFVGRSTYRKTVQDVKNAIDALPELGFSVINSKNKYGSLEKIKRVAKEYLWRANNGSIDCVFTYERFLDKVKSLSNDKGDPPTDPRHKNPSPPIVEDMPLTQEPTAATNMAQADAEESEELKQRREHLLTLSMNELKNLCRERAEKMAGSKVDLVQRLLQQRKPEILISRARRNQYVPKVPSCNAAILVALHLYHEPGTPPLSKEKIMMYAEECGVSKDPMFGSGKGWYDGWSGFKDLCGGDPPLVSVVKRKYALTTQPQGSSGMDVARAIHIVAHRQQLCRCGKYVDIS